MLVSAEHFYRQSAGHLAMQPTPRFRTETIPGGLRVTIPAARNSLAIIVLFLWLAVWFLGGGSILADDLEESTQALSALQIALCMVWLIGVGLITLVLLWQFAGIERLDIRGGALHYGRHVAGLGVAYEYALLEIQSLRVEALATSWGWHTVNVRENNAAPICFDYRGRTIRFGGQLAEIQSNELLSRMIASCPSLAAPTARA